MFEGHAENLLPRRTHDASQEVESIRSKYALPAMAGAVVEGDQIVLAGAAGFRKLGHEAKVTLADRFHIGSVTKSMTATLAGTLVESGKIQWKTTIKDVFGKDGKGVHADYLNVTLEQLLSHRGGAPLAAPVNLWKTAWLKQGSHQDQRFQFVKGLLEMGPINPPDSQYIYSNQGYSIAGVMLEKVAEKPWEKLMQENIFSPLGISSAGFGVPGILGEVTEPWGHVEKDGKLVPIQNDNPPAIGPAGTVHASIPDIARYASMHLQGHRGTNTAMLKLATWKKLHQAVNGQDYALGWMVREGTWTRGKSLWHNGSNTMFYIVVWVVPHENIAVVVAANAANGPAKAGCEDAAALLVERVRRSKN